MIAEDMKKDAANFDGKPFDGRTVATYFGNQGAAIAALADTIKEIVQMKLRWYQTYNKDGLNSKPVLQYLDDLDDELYGWEDIPITREKENCDDLTPPSD